MSAERYGPVIAGLLERDDDVDLREWPMFVRLALEEDRSVVLELAEAYFDEARDAFPTIRFDRGVAETTFSAYLETADPSIFVVEWQRQTVGFLCASIQGLRFARGIFAHCEALYVKPENRGSRAAALLLDAFDQWSDQIGAKFSLGGNQNNLDSDRTALFYEKFGFRRVGFHLMKPRGA